MPEQLQQARALVLLENVGPMLSKACLGLGPRQSCRASLQLRVDRGRIHARRLDEDGGGPDRLPGRRVSGKQLLWYDGRSDSGSVHANVRSEASRARIGASAMTSKIVYPLPLAAAMRIALRDLGCLPQLG